ncbi:MAG TPA: 2'-5' RNA ligase family protein [Ornithinibacter sp.]|nr:2'-5' RNA ligase family protein [Ornithinibacter sp.]
MIDHLIAPLDPDHDALVARLSRELAADLSIDPANAVTAPHITLVSYTGLSPRAAARALAPVARTTAALTVRAHGYGVFTGDVDTDLSLHVMVVRTRALDELQRRGHAALAAAGACLAGTTDPDVWTPHITLLGRGLTPPLLGRAVELLAHRPHRSWTVGISAVALTRRDAAGDRLTLQVVETRE